MLLSKSYLAVGTGGFSYSWEGSHLAWKTVTSPLRNGTPANRQSGAVPELTLWSDPTTRREQLGRHGNSAASNGFVICVAEQLYDQWL